MPFAVTCLDLEIVVLSEVRQRQIHDIAYIFNPKNDTNKLTYKTEIKSQMWETNLQLSGGKAEE